MKKDTRWETDSNRSLVLDRDLVAYQVARRFAVVDAPSPVGLMLQILTERRLIQAIHVAAPKTAESWDGTTRISVREVTFR